MVRKKVMTTMRKLPIGIQSFENIRNENYLYVDKTALIYQLVTKGKPCEICVSESSSPFWEKFIDIYVRSAMVF